LDDDYLEIFVVLVLGVGDDDIPLMDFLWEEMAGWMDEWMD